MSTGNELKAIAQTEAGAPAEAETAGSQYLTFSLADEQYGVDILRVVEIKGWTPVTRVPNTPPHMRGVLNMRGTIVPILDLRARFNLQEVEYTPTTVVIILSVYSGEHRRILGVVVDGVSDVVNVSPEDVKSRPDFGASVDMEFIRALATVNDRMVMLLDIDRLLSGADIEGMAQAAEESAADQGA